jgi:hypothetical protein
MRVMDLPPFPGCRIEIRDLEHLVGSRLSQTLVIWPNQAVPLLGYMCHPDDAAAREKLIGILRSWPDHSGSKAPPLPPRLSRIRSDWLKVADIFHIYCDLIGGQHQESRGGPSIGKAITLTSENAKARGTREANLWKLWSAYKDVAHLVCAAALITAQARTTLRDRLPRSEGLSPTQFNPFQMALLMPDLVLAVAMEFADYGLGVVADVEPVLDRNTLWQIPADINVAPLPPPFRKVRPQDIVVLNNRRAGKRGQANKVAPVSA